LLLVTVKAPALEDALGRVLAPPETVIPQLNGIEHMRTLRRRLSGSRVVAGSIGWIEAWLERPGVIVQNTPRVLMTLSSDADHASAELLRRSGVDTRVDGSEAAVLWEKLARQAPVAAATAATQRPIGERRSAREWTSRLGSASPTRMFDPSPGIRCSPTRLQAHTIRVSSSASCAQPTAARSGRLRSATARTSRSSVQRSSQRLRRRISSGSRTHSTSSEGT